MSLYIGKDNSNNNIMHINTSTVSLSILKSDTILPDTIFHSSLPYVQPIKFSCSFTYRDISVNYPFTSRRLFYITPNSEAISYISLGYEFAVIVKTANSNGKYVKLTNHIEYGGWSSNNTVDSTLKWGTNTSFTWSTPGITDLPTFTNNVLLMYNESSVLLKNDVVFNLPYNILNKSDVIYDAYILVLNIKNNSITPQLLASYTSDKFIKLDKSSFIINSNNTKIDMNKFTYLRRSLDNTGVNYFNAVNTSSKCFYVYTDISDSYGWKLEKYQASYAIYKKLSTAQYKSIFSKEIPLTTYTGVSTYSILNNTYFNSAVAQEVSVFTCNPNCFYHVTISSPSIKTYGHKGSLETNKAFTVHGLSLSYDDSAYGIIYVSDHLSIYSGEMSPKDSFFFIWAGVINNTFKVKIECKLGAASYNSSYIHTRLIEKLDIKVLKFYTNSIVN